LTAAIFTLKPLKGSHQDGTSKKEQERCANTTRTKEAKTEKQKAGAGNAPEPIYFQKQ